MGNVRKNIFNDSQDYERLTASLTESAAHFGARVYMYCWMSDHGHMMLETTSGNLREFMRSVLTDPSTLRIYHQSVDQPPA